MASKCSCLYWIDRVVIVLLLATLLGCRGSAADPVPADELPGEFRGGLPALTPSPEPARSVSYTKVIYSPGNAIFDSSDDTLFAGNSLVLSSSNTELGWARYAFNTGGYQPDKLVVGLGAGGNGAAWVAIANFARGRYDVHGPFTGNGTIPLGDLPEHDYLSAFGQVYALVIVSGGASVSINHIMLSYDNLVDPLYSITGTIIDENGSALPGIVVETFPNFSSAITDLQGNYLIGVDAADTYTVTPQGNLTNHTFTPVDSSVVVNGNETGVDFVGSRVDITGHIETGDGVGLKGVLLTLAPGGSTTLTDANGNFTFANVADNNYSVTPTLATYSFEPSSQLANVSGGDETEINFEATGGQPTYSISGKVLKNGSIPLEGVVITLNPGYLIAVTDALGFYEFGGLADQAIYTLVPFKSSYSFSPDNVSILINGADEPLLNFGATFIPTYTIGGNVQDSLLGALGIPDVKVDLYRFINTKHLATTYTDSAGNYSIPNVPDGDYVLKFYKYDYQWNGTSQIDVTVAGSDPQVGALGGSLDPGPTWENSVAALVGNSCVHCHRPDSDQAVDPPLRTYDEVIIAGTSSNNRIQNGTMPPFNPLPEYYKALFDKWRDDGYPEN